jgi:hypothetical protein
VIPRRQPAQSGRNFELNIDPWYEKPEQAASIVENSQANPIGTYVQQMSGALNVNDAFERGGIG